MGRTACTEPQCLYKGALYLYLSLSACTRVHFTFTFTSVPVQRCTLPLPLPQCLYKGALYLYLYLSACTRVHFTFTFTFLAKYFELLLNVFTSSGKIHYNFQPRYICVHCTEKYAFSFISLLILH
jgi:hypothetical protein